ncbi:SAM-dependent methyltransferase [Robertmurraya siralis]|uniref:SAM-dependent methyltransferase n=1 Tax=Robertmurraya siralis TaxID=77777 RepID=A0A919WEW5_9BACI|nr:SAM-dependent methyltransferase [Robertmurraya siralis]PAE21801.1 SAM-dependent methyltransferase [Bacillus sp. 7504-2]GIN60482.1 SAM-dependent methyltransferase [Robertmurraya siralis]
MLSYVKELIKARPEQMITYAELIGEALYHPQWGYYMKQGEKVGKKGDFITTSNVSDIYGRIMAKWFLKLKAERQLPGVVCELGAGNGRFAAAFIAEWNKSCDEHLSYYVVETSPYHRKLQKELLGTSIQQVESIDALKPFNGFIFSNELFDALPVHVVECHHDLLFEVMITVENDQLMEKRIPLNNNEIEMFMKQSKLKLNHKQRIEIPLAMGRMIARMADVVESGWFVTVDYGYSDEEWGEAFHREGSLRGYYQHEQIRDVLKFIGEMDITSHVHFDSLIRIGEKHGLEFVSKQRQDQFLISIGILEELENHVDPNPFSEVSRRNRAIRSLIMPSGMSAYFHVVVQKKGI